jgi:hypothetical protein
MLGRVRHPAADRAQPFSCRPAKSVHAMSEMTDDQFLGALVTYDFVTRFPHVGWISDWSSDDQYPDGFRYKVLTVRHEPERKIEVVVVMEEANGNKIERARLEVAADAFDKNARSLVAKLAARFEIEFEEDDLSDVRTAEEFDKRTEEIGWREWKPPLNG